MSRPASGDTYGLGERIRISVRFDRAVDRAGAFERRLALMIGDQMRQASSFTRGQGLTDVSFTYVVQATDRDLDGISVPADALTLNG